VVLTVSAAALAVLSFALTLWQWGVARRFPLHQRLAGSSSFAPAVTLLKPLKGSDAQTEQCLRSWLAQDYRGPVQILFGVASTSDPVCTVVRQLLGEFPKADAQLVICEQRLGPNAKVSTLVQLQAFAANEIVVISDADVVAPPDLLANIVLPLQNPGVGLVNCFYQLGGPLTCAMQWEAVAINADFWSQVLQARALKPLDFALGAVMATTQQQLEKIGGFAGLVAYLADDYQLGHKIAALGSRIELCPVVVACRSEVMGWKAVWLHQLRWGRTIRVCQPGPFFLSIVSNGTVWPLLWLALSPTPLALIAALLFLGVRVQSARSNQQRLTKSRVSWRSAWLVLLKDLAAVPIWALAFVGNQIQWRGHRYRMLPDGRLEPVRDSA
jgi:ceramide glucosyltransferase